MFKRFFTPPQNHSYFLFGPRGTGKSTWLKEYYKNALWFDLNDPKTFLMFSMYPEKLRSILAEKKEQTVVIDEVQKVPNILNVVHSLIEEKKGYQFVLTGSSARKLKKDGANLLGGRALLKRMPPFFAQELGSFFNLERNLRLGMLPIVLDATSPEEVLKAYVGIYLKEEVQAEGIARRVGDFARFLETISSSHGSTINASNIARECQIARKTVDSYLQILEDQVENYGLHFWQTSSKLEVDFILSGPDTFLAIEVKNGTAIHPSDLRGLLAFKEDYPESTLLLLYRGKERFREKDVLVFPVDDFLKLINPNEPFVKL
ncbi:MAG: AAA family ATPase [Chlamydiae bacterium]|nr:AAA family ATPase [Chlamydiota bacterium]